MNNAFDELINKLDKAEERVSELEDRSETCQLKNKEKIRKKQHPKTAGRL